MCLFIAQSINVLFVLLTFVLLFSNVYLQDDTCRHCKLVIEAFNEGMEKTKNSNFGGGNTKWENEKLGDFKNSLTRFEEVLEHLFNKKFETQELQFKCQALAEDIEDVLKNWYLKLQNTHSNLFQYMCVDNLKRCCMNGYYGSNCLKCPGLLIEDKMQNATKRECYGRGICNGSGTRQGTGKCECEKGYVGVMCSNCDAHYYSVVKNLTYIECNECYEGCAGDCNFSGPKGCKTCRSGFIMDEKEGCIDVDECAFTDAKKKCTNKYEICHNTIGSFTCQCEEGYKRSDDNKKCEIDAIANPYSSLVSPDTVLRLFSIFGLFGISVFVLIFHRTPFAIGLNIIGIIAAVFIENYYELIIPKATKTFLAKNFF